MAVYWNEGVEYAFISYSTEEYRYAAHLKESLTKNGITSWMAPDSIEGGKSYASEIPQAIRNAKVFIIVLSKSAMKSQWVEKELDTALKNHIPVLPYKTDDIALTESFDFYLTNIQIYNAFLAPLAALEKLIRDIRIRFDSIDIQENAWSIVDDPIKMVETLPHYFDTDYLLMGRYRITEMQKTYMEGVQSYKAIDCTTNKAVYVAYLDKTVPYSMFSHGFSSRGALFQHRAISTPLDEFSTDNYFISVEEFYSVKSLSEVLSYSGDQSPLKVLTWAIPICDALDYMHRKKGFVYGGMNLINIRLKENGQPLLFDVGGAGKIGSKYAQVAPWAWNTYPAAQKYSFLEPSGDLYALAYCMLMALGADIFRNDYRSDIYQALDIMDFFKKIKKRIPKKLYSILHKCLVQAPYSAHQMKHDLHDCYKDLKLK